MSQPADPLAKGSARRTFPPCVGFKASQRTRKMMIAKAGRKLVRRKTLARGRAIQINGGSSRTKSTPLEVDEP
jgi:hypothetical protein